MDAQPLLPSDPRYPARLVGLKKPPPLEWIGPELRGPVLAIVGSRRASPDALRFARQLAASAAKGGALILSGGALGIDGAAHEGALDAKGRTAAVLVGPLSSPSPARHRVLFRRMLAAGGSLLAPADLTRCRAAFVERNLYLAALADHVVVVAAATGSGSLRTGRHALQLSRPLWTVPGPPWQPEFAGCLALLQEGARVLTGFEELAAAMALAAPRPVVERCPRRAWLRKQGEAFPEDFALALGLSPAEVFQWASREELAGRLRRTPQGRLTLL